MLTTNHFIWLALCAVGIVAGLFAAQKKGIDSRKAAKCAVIICAFSETCKIATHMLPSPQGGFALDPWALPFHLCSMQIFVILCMAFSGNEKLRQKVISFFVPSGLLGGIAAILIPIDGVDFLDCLAYQGFVYHAGLVWLALYFLISKQVDMGFAAYKRNLLILLALGVAAIYINGLCFDYGTNFMFVVRPPMEGLPILNMNHGWYVYFLSLAALGAGLMTLVHLPFMLAERKK